MNRSLILDLVVLSTVLIAIARGWSRRSIREAFALLGVTGGVVLLAVATGPVSALIRAVSPADGGLSRVLAVAILFFGAALAGTITGFRIARRTHIPAPRRLDASGGAAFAMVRIGMIVALALIALDVVWGPESVGHRMIADSVSGRVLTGEQSPFGALYASVLERSADLRAVEAWVRQEDPDPAGYRQSELEATDARLEPQPGAEREMFDAVNREREERGLIPLKWCERCADVARAHSKNMYRGGYFSHEDLEGNDPFDRMTNAGISYGAAGENLALAPTVAEALEGLMASPDHRANILRDRFQEIGIGILKGPYGLMFTQVFRARP